MKAVTILLRNVPDDMPSDIIIDAIEETFWEDNVDAEFIDERPE